MKKVLLSSAAIVGLASMATPAAAQVQLELGGFFKGYGAYVSQDEDPDDIANAPVDDSQEANSFDIIRSTEVHFGGETTLDNGLTVGAHIEATADGGDSFTAEESYVYFSGGWGRVNAGAEDGAQYLLQVEAPSADDNIDGLRQYVQPVNAAVLTANSGSGDGVAPVLLAIAGTGAITSLDYSADATGYADKLTYLTPIMNGFQAGLSYTPDVPSYADSFGVGTTDVLDTFGDAWEAAFRYEGQFNNVGVNLGAGYTRVALEQEGSQLFGGVNAVAVGDPTDDRSVWNVGADFNIGPFGIGAGYKRDDNGERTQAAATALAPAVTGDDERTYVVGVDYTTGPFKLGASYMDVKNVFGVNNLDADRWAAGVTYTYGPGMTFRGSVGYLDAEGAGIGGDLNSAPVVDVTRNDVDATYVTLGTQINF
jgi:outer membrane protein OmpU